MLKRLGLTNFTVFGDETLTFADGLNVTIGVNGAGKSHLLKLAYSLAHVCADATLDPSRMTKTWLSKAMGEKLVNVFRPDALGRLVRRGTGGRQRCEIGATFKGVGSRIDFGFATNSKTDVSVTRVPSVFKAQTPIFFPTREVISIFPGFAALYRDRYVEFDETYYDLCLALEKLPLRGKRAEDVRTLIEPLEQAFQGRVAIQNGRFYLQVPGQGNLEMHLVAEGMRKLAMLAYLITNGSLRDRGMLFWDEPETNLNPQLIRLVAQVILSLCRSGVQVFIATHSLFLLRELEIQSTMAEMATISQRFFAMDIGDEGVTIQQGNAIEDVDPLILLDEDLMQSDRFIGADMPNLRQHGA